VVTRVGLSVENSLVVGNVATRSVGGGTYVDTDSTLSVSNTTFENNTAGDRGGESATLRSLQTRIYLFGDSSRTTSSGILT
jgi:hypothetical protein